MLENILSRIESLPPLPKTIADIEEFRRKSDKEADELLSIVEKDALIVSTLLKISNSAMFGFRSKVETPGRAINLLGINFTISIAIGGTVQNLLMANLSPYSISSDDFMRASNLASTLTHLWVSKVNYDLKEELLLPALLQEAGKFIIADVIVSENKTEDFKKLLAEGKSTAEVEKELIGFSTSEITAKIFRHWKLSPKLIDMIENVDNISNVLEGYEEHARVLHVVKTACDVTEPLNDTAVANAIVKAEEFGFDTTPLEAAIEKLQDRLLEE
jgi:HD-like signal output (HDOD) protein